MITMLATVSPKDKDHPYFVTGEPTPQEFRVYTLCHIVTVWILLKSKCNPKVKKRDKHQSLAHRYCLHIHHSDAGQSLRRESRQVDNMKGRVRVQPRGQKQN